MEERTKQEQPPEELAAKRYLSRYRECRQTVESGLLRIRTLREQAASISAALSPIRVQGGGDRDRVGRSAAGIADEAARLEKEVERQTAAMREVEALISRVSDERQREVLRWRYLNLLPFEAVADKMGYCRMQVNRIHRRALLSAGKLLLEGGEAA